MKNNKNPETLHEHRESEFVYGIKDSVRVLSNSELECANCIYALPHAGICRKYRPKPADVLCRRAPCPSFASEEIQTTDLISENDGHSAVVTHTPQCVGCTYNQGGFHCAMFVRKPEELLMNERSCPARKPE